MIKDQIIHCTSISQIELILHVLLNIKKLHWRAGYCTADTIYNRYDRNSYIRIGDNVLYYGTINDIPFDLNHIPIISAFNAINSIMDTEEYAHCTIASVKYRAAKNIFYYTAKYVRPVQYKLIMNGYTSEMRLFEVRPNTDFKIYDEVIRKEYTLVYQ